MVVANTLDDILYLDKPMRENNKMQIYITDDMLVNFLDVAIRSAMEYMQTVGKDIMTADDVKAFDGWERLPFICGERNNYNVVCVIKESERSYGLTFIGEHEYIVLSCIASKEDIRTAIHKYFDSLSVEDQCLIAITDLSSVRKLFD